MKKYRVLKPYPKQIMNSGRLITLRPGSSVYLKRESQVLRLVKMGFLKPMVEMPKKRKKPAKAKKQEPKQSEPKSEPKQEESSEQKDDSEQEQKRKSKSEYLSKKKNKGK